MSQPTAVEPPTVVNAYVDYESNLVLMHRDGDERIVSRVPADFASYHRVSDVTPEKRSRLEMDDGLRSLRREGDWYRVEWRNWMARKFAIQDDGILTRLHIPHFEADVHPVKRYLVDSGARIQKPRRAFLDIETDSRLSFSKLRAGLGRVLCWTVVNEVGKIVSGCLAEDTDKAEQALLVEMLRTLDDYDQVLAWNGDGFDFMVLNGDRHPQTKTKGRIRHLGIKVDMRRWLWLDHMALFKRMNLQVAKSGDEKQSFKLGDIARSVLHDGKDKFDASKSWEAWACTDPTARYNRDALVRYNQKDTDLLRRIEEKTGFCALLDTIGDACGVLPDSRGMRPLNQLDPFMLRLGLEQGTHFPTIMRFEQEDDRKKFKGAYVQEPSIAGMLRDVHVCDFKSLYPSIIISWNMSPETKVPGSRGPYLVGSDVPANCARAPGTGVMFRTDIKGLLPMAVGRLLELRARWKTEKSKCAPGTPESASADRKSNAYKVTGNAFFGGTGNEFSRFFDVDVAESVTQAGVHLIHEVEAAVLKVNWESVYQDSITGDRTVVVRDPRGRTHVLPIEKLWSQATDVRAVDKDRGLLPGWHALARDEGGFEGWFPVSGIIQHRVSKDLWRISTNRGQTEVTADHGIMLGSEAVPPAKFVKAGAPFEVVRAQPSTRPSDLVDLWSCLSSTVVKGSHRKSHAMTRRFQLTNDGDIQLVSHTDRVGSKLCDQYHERIRRWFVPGSEELHALLRFLAAYISEGSATIAGITTKRGSFLSIAQNDPKWLEALRDDLKCFVSDVGELSVKEVGPGMYALRAHTCAMSILFGILCGVGSRGKFLPSFIFDLSKEDFLVFWRKIVEGDGHVHKMILRGRPGRKPHDSMERVSYTSNSQTLIAGLSYALDQHDIEHSISFREEKESWDIRTRPSGSSRKQRVVHVERRKSDGYVYDLSVQGAHTFVDGLGRVLLHNTDGLYARGDVDRHGFSTFVKETLNGEVIPRVLEEHGCVTKTVAISYEKQFDRICFTGLKKRYFGKYLHYEGTDPKLDSEPEIKGLEFKRGDTNQIARVLQERVIRMLLGDWQPTCRCGKKCDHGPEDKAPKGRRTAWLWTCPRCGPREDHELHYAAAMDNPEDFRLVVVKARDHVLTAKLPLAYVKVSKGIQQPIDDYVQKKKQDGTDAALPPHVQVAKLLFERGEDVSVGTKIAYVVVDGADTIKAIPADDYVGECDRFYLWENLIWPPIERILTVALPGTPWDKMFGRVRPAKERPPKRGGAAPGQVGLFGGGIPPLDVKKFAPITVDGTAGRPAVETVRALGGAGIPGMRRRDRPFVIHLGVEGATREVLEALREACDRHPGPRPVQLSIDGTIECLGEASVDVLSGVKVVGARGLIEEIGRILGR